MRNIVMFMALSFAPILFSYFIVYLVLKSILKAKIIAMHHLFIFLLVWIIASFPYFFSGDSPYSNPAFVLLVPAGISAIFIVPVLFSAKNAIVPTYKKRGDQTKPSSCEQCGHDVLTYDGFEYSCNECGWKRV